MGHIQVFDFAVAVPVQIAVVGEHEPGGKIRRILPRVTQDAAVAGFDVQASMAQARDLHPTALSYSVQRASAKTSQALISPCGSSRSGSVPEITPFLHHDSRFRVGCSQHYGRVFAT